MQLLITRFQIPDDCSIYPICKSPVLDALCETLDITRDQAIAIKERCEDIDLVTDKLHVIL